MDSIATTELLNGTGIAAADTFGTTSVPGVFAATGLRRTLARQAQ